MDGYRYMSTVPPAAAARVPSAASSAFAVTCAVWDDIWATEERAASTTAMSLKMGSGVYPDRPVALMSMSAPSVEELVEADAADGVGAAFHRGPIGRRLPVPLGRTGALPDPASG